MNSKEGITPMEIPRFYGVVVNGRLYVRTEGRNLIALMLLETEV